MKTKLAYMALGALMASIGYFIGTFSNLNAQDEVARVKKLFVSEMIRVGDPDSLQVKIEPAGIMILGVDTNPVAIVMGQGQITICDNLLSNPEDRNRINLSIVNTVPLINMEDTEGKFIRAIVGKQSEIKLSNGGLKSKTVAVD